MVVHPQCVAGSRIIGVVHLLQKGVDIVIFEIQAAIQERFDYQLVLVAIIGNLPIPLGIPAHRDNTQCNLHDHHDSYTDPVPAQNRVQRFFHRHRRWSDQIERQGQNPPEHRTGAQIAIARSQPICDQGRYDHDDDCQNEDGAGKPPPRRRPIPLSRHSTASALVSQPVARPRPFRTAFSSYQESEERRTAAEQPDSAQAPAVHRPRQDQTGHGHLVPHNMISQARTPDERTFR